MGRVCAWCGAFLSLVDGPRGSLSHTLCGGCFEDLLERLEASGLRAPAARQRRAGAALRGEPRGGAFCAV